MKKKYFLILFILFGINATVFAQNYFSQNFESGTTGWTLENQWEVGTNTTMSSQYFQYPAHTTFAGVNDDGAGSGVNTTGKLISPSFSLLTATYIKLSFDLFYFNENYNGIGQETFKVFASNNGGVNWVLVGQITEGNGAWRAETMNLSAYAGQSIKLAFEYGDGNNWNYGVGIDNISVDELPSNDVSLNSINTPNYAQLGSISITGTVENLGGAPLSSFDVIYSINGGASSSVYSVTGLNVVNGQTYDFTHNVPYNFSSTGNYSINVDISNVNNGVDANITNNTLNKDIIIYENAVQRKILLENFTTAVCPNCPPVHTLLENYVATEPNAFIVAQHAGYYTDAMTVPENTELLAMYNDGGGTYAPALAVDRFHFPEGLGGTEADPGPVFFPSSSTTYARLDERLEVPSFVNVNINGSYSGTALSLDITGDLVADLSAGEKRLVVYIIEDGLVYNQSGGTSTYVHNHVMRDAISGTWGDTGVITSITSGSTFSKHYNYTMNSSWNVNKLHIVAFVANYGTTVNDREVLNAQIAKLTTMVPLGQDDTVSLKSSVFPTLTDNILYIQTEESLDIKIFDLMGRMIFSQNDLNGEDIIDVSQLNPQAYFVEMIGENGSKKVQKIIIE